LSRRGRRCADYIAGTPTRATRNKLSRGRAGAPDRSSDSACTPYGAKRAAAGHTVLRARRVSLRRRRLVVAMKNIRILLLLLLLLLYIVTMTVACARAVLYNNNIIKYRSYPSRRGYYMHAAAYAAAAALLLLSSFAREQRANGYVCVRACVRRCVWIITARSFCPFHWPPPPPLPLNWLRARAR
jgi:hypothetical protein